MRLIDFRIEKSHSFYLIIYQYFKSIFSAKDETMRLFFKKKLFHVRENYESFKQFIEESSTCMVKNGLKAQSG
ncbi:hypothetical protein DW830_02965 [Prevotella sp. AM34-19LB]|nr:hypothetical protein DW830_02965 [Prevotella sp. AM34-19LB]